MTCRRDSSPYVPYFIVFISQLAGWLVLFVAGFGVFLVVVGGNFAQHGQKKGYICIGLVYILKESER